jgi:hypothetical protein
MRALSAALSLAWLFAIIALHIVNPELPLAAHTVSEYVRAKGGWALRCACFSMAASQGAAARELAKMGLNSAAELFWALCALFFIMGVFDTDPVVLKTGERRTLRGAVHIAAATGAIALFNAAAAVNASNTLFRILAAALALSTILFIGSVIGAISGKKAIYGITQRINIVIVTLWQTLFVIFLGAVSQS